MEDVYIGKYGIFTRDDKLCVYKNYHPPFVLAVTISVAALSFLLSLSAKVFSVLAVVLSWAGV